MNVIITGSTRGLGLEMAKVFYANNSNVVISGTKQDTVDKVVEELKKIKSTGAVAGKKCNVVNLDEVQQLADFAVEKFGKIDIWINNAGVNQSYKTSWELSDNEINFMMDVDLKGTINGSVVAMRQMIKQNSGAIYNMEGLGSNDAIQFGFSIYGTTKRAVTYYTDTLIKETKTLNLPVIIGKLSPGIMITDFLTSAEGKTGKTELSEKTKKVYNILGDYPDVIAAFLVKKILSNKKNGKRFMWLTNKKAFFRFLTAGINKRNFFN